MAKLKSAAALLASALAAAPAARAAALSNNYYHGCVVTPLGVKCWGFNSNGRLGVPSAASDRDVGDDAADLGDALAFIPLGEVPLAVETGQEFSCALMPGGAVKCWGFGRSGQLGNEAGGADIIIATASDVPSDVNVGEPVAELAVGKDHVCVVVESNRRVKCWGKNEQGQLGYGDTSARGAASGTMGAALPYVDLGNDSTLKPNRVLSLAMGDEHTCALTESLKIKCWGANEKGQLGYGDVEKRGATESTMGEDLPVVQVASSDGPFSFVAGGQQRTCAIDADGGVACWGALVANGGLETFKEMDALPAIALAGPATSVGSGEYVTCATLGGGAETAGKLQCWGGNLNGEVGAGSFTEVIEMSAPVTVSVSGDAADVVETLAVGFNHVCVRRNTLVGDIVCWGSGSNGRLGRGDKALTWGKEPSHMGAGLVPVDLGVITAAPTQAPTSAPSVTPTASPSTSPSTSPTAAPSTTPTQSPTQAPSTTPTQAPTQAPLEMGNATWAPTDSPTPAPTLSPTASPSAFANATLSPTLTPTSAPTASPSAAADGTVDGDDDDDDDDDDDGDGDDGDDGELLSSFPVALVAGAGGGGLLLVLGVAAAITSARRRRRSQRLEDGKLVVSHYSGRSSAASQPEREAGSAGDFEMGMQDAQAAGAAYSARGGRFVGEGQQGRAAHDLSPFQRIRPAPPPPPGSRG